ncbi:glycosyltransferase family 2 protein [Chryseobacterium gambrini]|uniref:glycosyltransferase family 2 protein n=1 Tax=Chryseobacterium gambrini TaxID=373672 RepID=UPI003D11F291
MKTSVAVCTYNGEKFLQQQIDSILNQTHPVDEIIVCDDGSTDATVEILNSYKEKYPELFQIHINEKNLRSVKNFEKAISLCTHEIIFLSDQDDIWVENKVEKYLDYFENHPETEVIASNGFGIDDDGKLLDVITIWDVIGFMKAKNIKIDFFEIISFSGNIATGATMAIKKDFVKKTIPFPLVPEFHHDEWIALIAASENRFDFIDDKMFYYRQHQSQQVGGVFFDNNERKKNTLLRFFSLDFNVQTFSNYKHLLKRIANSYQKHKHILEESQVHHDIFSKNLDLFKSLYYKYKEEMKKKYPVRFFILNIVDKIKNKRQLEK